MVHELQGPSADFCGTRREQLVAKRVSWVLAVGRTTRDPLKRPSERELCGNSRAPAAEPALILHRLRHCWSRALIHKSSCHTASESLFPR